MNEIEAQGEALLGGYVAGPNAGLAPRQLGPPVPREVGVALVHTGQVPAAVDQGLWPVPTDALRPEAFQVLCDAQLFGQRLDLLLDVVGRNPEPVAEGAEPEPCQTVA